MFFINIKTTEKAKPINGLVRKAFTMTSPEEGKRGFTLVEIMIVIAVIALLSAIAIPNLLRARITANEAAAMSTLKSISNAAEIFATANNGLFPSDESSLVVPAADPPYYYREYCSQIIQGYYYSCRWHLGGYAIVASPAAPGSGTHTYTITTGGALTGM